MPERDTASAGLTRVLTSSYRISNDAKLAMRNVATVVRDLSIFTAGKVFFSEPFGFYLSVARAQMAQDLVTLGVLGKP